MNLFELNDAYRSLMEMDTDQLDPQTLADTLDGIKDAREVKWDNLAAMIERLNQEGDMLKQKAKTFSEEGKSRENKAKRLKQYLLESLDDAGVKKIDTDNHVLSTRNNKASVVVDDQDSLPAEFIKTTTVVKANPDKTKLYQALKAGDTIDGAHLQPNRGVTIK